MNERFFEIYEAINLLSTRITGSSWELHFYHLRSWEALHPWLKHCSFPLHYGFARIHTFFPPKTHNINFWKNTVVTLKKYKHCLKVSLRQLSLIYQCCVNCKVRQKIGCDHSSKSYFKLQDITNQWVVKTVLIHLQCLSCALHLLFHLVFRTALSS